MADEKKKKERVGAFWMKKLASGKVVYNGYILITGEQHRFNLWVNDKGDNPARPDLVAVVDDYEPKPKA